MNLLKLYVNFITMDYHVLSLSRNDYFGRFKFNMSKCPILLILLVIKMIICAFLVANFIGLISEFGCCLRLVIFSIGISCSIVVRSRSCFVLSRRLVLIISFIVTLFIWSIIFMCSMRLSNY